MPNKIQLLPDSIANQIAAGEVVQRPASVIKELMENSLDAGATHIRVIVKEAGKQLIQVIDNGSGMSEVDARMSLERHATSKIRKADDLFTLTTMGFRGEALASIAAVAQVEIKTRLQENELGTQILVAASEVQSQEFAVCDVGTSIAVKNLFFNIPARRNFLKSNPVEFRHITEEFQRIALANPSISFELFHGDEVVFDLPSTKEVQRIIALFGKSFQGQLANVQEETDRLKVSGFIGKPSFARKSRGDQYLYVNHRFIRSSYLNHAVISAFEGLIQDNTYPFYVLFLELDPGRIDVNVHPTKTEIKFDDERTVYAVVRSAVRQALGMHNLSPTIDFHSDVNLLSKLQHQPATEAYFDERFSSSLNRSNLESWEKLFEPRLQPESEVPQLEFVPPVATVRTDEPMFQLNDRYIVKPVKTGLMLVDQQAAHERILFEKFTQQLRTRVGTSQQLLFPGPITLGVADFTLISEMQQELESLGFRFELFGRNTLLITGVPAGIASTDGLLEGVIAQFKQNQAELSIPMQENLARSLARRSSIKGGQVLSRTEMTSLISGLNATKTPNFAPDGRATYIILELSKIESYFR